MKSERFFKERFKKGLEIYTKIKRKIKELYPYLNEFNENPEKVLEEIKERAKKLNINIEFLRSSNRFVGTKRDGEINFKIDDLRQGDTLIVGISSYYDGTDFHELVHIWSILERIDRGETLSPLERLTAEAYCEEVSASILGLLCDVFKIRKKIFSPRTIWSMYVNAFSLVVYASFLGLAVRELEGLIKNFSIKIKKN